MKLVHNHQTWKGVFTYNDGYDEADQYIDIDFKLELIFTDKSFIGISVDSESQGIFDKPAEVKGFVDDEKISFILIYPCYYYKDDNGQIVLDRESRHPDIYYLGFWENEKNWVRGTWEMKIYEEKDGDDYIVELATGEFEMRRV